MYLNKLEELGNWFVFIGKKIDVNKRKIIFGKEGIKLVGVMRGSEGDERRGVVQQTLVEDFKA